MSTPKESSNARLQNDYGADLWVRDPRERRHNTIGRGLFAGLQDTKKYNVEGGWASRHQGEQPGLIGTIWRRFTGANYTEPTD